MFCGLVKEMESGLVTRGGPRSALCLDQEGSEEGQGEDGLVVFAVSHFAKQ